MVEEEPVRQRFRVLVVMTALLFTVATATLAVRAGDDDRVAAAPVRAGADGGCVAQGGPSTAKAVLACVSRSLAFVETPLGTGSGILVAGRYVVTNAHVVDPFAAVDLSFGPGDHHEGVPVKGVDLAADLAIVGPVDTTRRTLELAEPAGLVKGDDLFLVGYPGEVDDQPEATISRGILSRTRQAEEFGLTFLQTDAAIGGGQSGGALVDGRGRVVGMSGYSFADEFALALSGADARRSIERILAGELAPYRPFPETGLATTGSIDLTDTEDFQVLTLRTGAEKQAVRLSLPAEARPAVLVSDFEGTEVFFQNQEALDAMAESAGLDAEVLGEEEADAPVAPGVFEFEVPDDTYAVIVVGSRREGASTLAFESSVPLGRYDDADDERPLQLGDRLEGVVDGLESGDTFLVDLRSGEEVEIFAGSATGDVGFSIRAPGMAVKDEVVVDDSDVGLFHVDAEDTFEPESSGIHRITVFSADGRATGYVVRVRRT